MEKPRILVVDDDPKLVHLVRQVLSASDYDVLTARSGEAAVELCALEKPDLVLLDLILTNGMDGYQAARHIREFSEVPIIMLTARARETDILKGFEVGADDYITKPFNARELLARIRAVLKRATGGAASEVELTCGELRLDLARRRVWVGPREVRLTPTEYRLLHELAVHINRVLTHEQLLTAVWGSEYQDDLDYLRAYIYNLRKKIESDPETPQYILRCPGVGYMLACPENGEPEGC